MPEEANATWDSVSLDTPSPVVDPPVEVVPPVSPPAETPTLEKPETPELDAQSVPVRESVSEAVVEPPKEEAPKTDEYVAEASDPPEIAALPTAAAKRWAKRQHQDAAPVRTFLNFEQPIKEFGDDLYKRSPSRYAEHVKEVLESDRDWASKQLFGVSYDEAKTKLQTNAQPAPITTTANPPSAVTLPTETELNEMTIEQAVQRFQQYESSQQTAREQEKQQMQSAFEAKVKTLQEQFDAVNGKITSKEETDKQTEISNKQTELYNNVWSVVEEGIRNSGLEVLPADPPKIASLKRAAARLLDNHNVQAAFDAIEENGKLVKYVYEATNRREFDNAFREEDNLKVRARAAFESVKSSPEVKAIFDEIEAYANQSKTTSRAANPIPPAPGSTAGVVVKPPTTWDEAVSGAAA